MSSNPTTHLPTNSSQSTKRTGVVSYIPSNASLLIEKTKHNLRRSTPDSEALASSDDEQDHHRFTSQTGQQLPRPTRRPSWIAEPTSNLHHKNPTSSSGAFSPGITPNGSGSEAIMWASTGSPLARIRSNGPSLPWNSQIWSNDAPSNTTPRFPESTAQIHSQESKAPPSHRDSVSDAAIPFAIPLQPTLKAYRSQSYSVGQMEQETIPNASNGLSNRVMPYATIGRIRGGSSYGGPQHRTSRPSLLGDYTHDNAILEQLREVDDDDEESNISSELGRTRAQSQARHIEQLVFENARLRQESMENQMTRMNLSNQVAEQPLMYGYAEDRVNHHLSAQSNAIEDIDEVLDVGYSKANHPQRNGLLTRRLSEYGTYGGSSTPSSSVENRVLENVRRGHWQSSLGFGGIPETPQSRRHSFVDVPKRQISMSSLNEPRQGSNGQTQQHYTDRDIAVPYGTEFYRHEDLSEEFHPLQSGLYSMASPSLPQTKSYAHFQHARLNNGPHRSQSLYLVTFKCARAEFFYVPEGMGLDIKAGDLVIVEADRGTDLGTVAHANFPWSDAKVLRDQYAEEHYKWLMMFSRRRPDTSNGDLNNANSVVAARNGISTVGGMGPSSTTRSVEQPSTEIKPKMIKRLAQPNDISALKDKEASEARAKRMCQAKADEHHLDMEILDAEFQMDWKKLTFYYFADSYVNFNSLVTDLFKLYKTRIWMSAINPESFASQNAGLQPPSGLGPGAVTTDRERFDQSRQRPAAPPAAWTSHASSSLAGFGVVRNNFHDYEPTNHIAPNFNLMVQAQLGSQAPYGLASYTAADLPPIQPRSFAPHYTALHGWP